MQKTLAAVTVAALVGVTGAANAADVYSRGGLKDGPAYVAPETTWTGFHIGLGGAAEAYNLKEIDPGSTWDGNSATGVVGTVEVGYDRQLGNFVAGVFFNYDFGDNVSLEYKGYGYTEIIKQTGAWTIGGRLGYLLNASTLAYVLGGYSEAEIDDTYYSSSSTTRTLTGWTVGGGLETKLTGNWTLKGEYRFTGYDSFTVNTCSECTPYQVEPSVQSGRLVLSYKFGGDDVLPLK